MSMLQINANGLSTQTQTEIWEELMAKLQAIFGNSLNTDISSISGQFGRIMSELRAVDQQALLDVYRSFDPNGAYGTALDARAALTGSVRHGESFSTVEGLIEFAGVGAVANGDLILNVDQDTQWELINGPVTDGGGPYPEFVAATFEAVDPGPIYANAGTTWSVITISPNFTGFTNPVEDATPGEYTESDADFRRRRTIELFAQGQGPLSTINAIVSKVNTANGRVDTVRTYHNPNINPVDSDNIPFKAFNVVVETTPAIPPAGLQQDIFDAILSAMGAGGYAYGTGYMGFSTDTEGQMHPIAFDVISEVDVYLAVNVDLVAMGDPDGPVVPADQLQFATLIRDTCVATAASFKKIGRDVRELDYLGAIQNLILTGQISGVIGAQVQLSTVSKLGPYTPTSISIGIREKPDTDSGEISVALSGTVVIP